MKMKTLKEIRVIRILDAITDEVELIAKAKEVQPHKAIKMLESWQAELS